MAFTNFSKPPIQRSRAVSTNVVMMKLNRDFSVASTLGHIITFKKGVPMPVPGVMVRSCAQVGAERVDGKDALTPEVTETPTQPVDPGERLDDVGDAVKKLAEENDTSNFTASGSPKVQAVSDTVGYKVDRTEVQRAWKEYKVSLVDDAE